MAIFKLIFSVAMMVFVFSSCTTGLYVSYLSDEKLPSKPAGCELVLTAEKHNPDEAVVISVLTAGFYSLETVKSEMEKYACSIGGDGISEYFIDISRIDIKAGRAKIFKFCEDKQCKK